MNFQYICGGETFPTEEGALKFASEVYTKTGTILGIAKVEVDSDEARMNLIDAVIHQIKIDVENGEFSAIQELLDLIPDRNLYNFLSDDVKEEMQNV